MNIAQLIMGVLLVAGAGIAYRKRGALAEEVATWNRLQYDRRVSLLNRHRAERLADAYSTGPLDRWGVVFGCVIAAIVGVSVIVGALT